jgi:nicotinamide phosphoribosyltransferase
MNIERKEIPRAEQNGIMYQIRQKYGVTYDTDSYKLSHHCQYVQGAQRMASYVESRGGLYDETLWYGLQLILKEYFLQRLTQAQADNMIAWAAEHMMADQDESYLNNLKTALQTVIDEYDGKLPIRIRAAREGLLIPVKNVLAVIESTENDPRLFSLVSFFETKLLRVWSPTTVATTSYNIRKAIYAALVESADEPDAEIAFKLHDFGSRGVSAGETAAFAGSGHLVSFMGSDTTAAIMAAELGYNERMAGYSIFATEHSTTTTHGRFGEAGFVSNVFDHAAKPGAIFATVIDSYDAIAFIREIVPKFKDRLIESGATWVLRPDSCDPVKMPIQTVVELDKIMGSVVNSKGFKVLNNVRVIQGDGIGPDDVKQILKELMALGYSASNIAFGMGGGLLQKNDRDTQKFSMKCSAVMVNGEWHDVYKNPAIYDDDWNKIEGETFKVSKAGRLELFFNRETGEYATAREDSTEYDGWARMLELTYENGDLVRDMTFAEVRANAGTFV